MHPLDGPFLKLERAKEHFDIIHEVIKRLTERKAHIMIGGIEGEGETREYIVRLKQVEHVPTNFPLILGDGFSNLRSCLDHLVWQLHLLRFKTFSKNVKFPIWDNEDLFKANTAKDIGLLTDSQRALIEGMQPYRTKNNALSILRDANDTDKHRLIQIVSLCGNVESLTCSFDPHPMTPIPVGIFKIISPGSVIDDSTIVSRVALNSIPCGTQVEVQQNLSVDHVFKGGKINHPQRITPTLRNMVSQVELTLKCLEPEFAHLGTSVYKEYKSMKGGLSL